MITNKKKNEKTTEIYFDETPAAVVIRTHNSALKKRLLAFAAKFPNLCQLTDVIGVEIDDEVGGLDKLLADIDYMNISVDYLYICYERKENKVIAVIHTDTEIAAILARKGWPIVSDR